MIATIAVGFGVERWELAIASITKSLETLMVAWAGAISTQVQAVMNRLVVSVRNECIIYTKRMRIFREITDVFYGLLLSISRFK